MGPRIFSSPRPLDRLWGPSSHIQWVPGALSPRVKWPMGEADHSTPTCAAVKKMWTSHTLSCRSARLVKHRENFYRFCLNLPTNVKKIFCSSTVGRAGVYTHTNPGIELTAFIEGGTYCSEMLYGYAYCITVGSKYSALTCENASPRWEHPHTQLP
jgi:hypothetical protein